ncbi:MAG: LUD domain-containing protein [Haloferacaceae archaeon]
MTERSDRAEAIRRTMAADGDAIHENTANLNRNRYDAMASLDGGDALRRRAREIKEDAVARLPELIDRVEDAVEANGGHVYVADDAADANRYVREVASERDAATAVKSKSMTTEELELNDALADAGVDVYETDLGEFVIQVAEESPSHIVGPAMHRSRDEIAALFNDYFDPEEPFETADELTRFARDYLGEKIRGADLGVTGANFVLADSGTVVLVTNEGNARKTAVTPDAHVAVAGVEKLLPSIDDLQPFVELIARSATGQSIAQYVSMLSPPTDSPTLDFDAPDEPNFGGDSGDGGDGNGDRAFHLVLVDNGRFEMREDDQLRETLYCIRCGACSNSCANFQHVGGHAFGGETYSGGIAAGWEAGVHGLDATESFNDLCTGCTRCVDACPVEIDVPWVNTVVRDRLNRGADPDAFDSLVAGLTPDDEPSGLALDKRLFGNFGTLAKWGSATAPLSNWAADAAPVRALLERVTGVDRRRDLPTFARETFVDWYADRESTVDRPDATVALYPDVYTNYVRPDRGRAAVRVLEAAGVRVDVPPVSESGRAPLSQGMVSTAEDRAAATYAALEPALEADHEVVVLEPSDLAIFRREYERLLPESDAATLADASRSLPECLATLDLPAGLAGDDPVAYHAHCQGRTVGELDATTALLDRLGHDVVTSAEAVECCGMAGSFGYKEAYYDLSVEVGETLADWVAGHPDRTLVAGGASCLDQLDALVDRTPLHLAELLDPER